MDVEAESSVAESASRKGESGDGGQLPPRRHATVSVPSGYAGENRESGGDEPASWKRRKRKRGEDGPARPNRSLAESEAAGSTYDVFLGSEGSDDVFGFANWLCSRFRAVGICVFRDDGIVQTPPELPPTVSSSKIYMPVFSRTYAYSPRCLETLLLMVDRASRSGGQEEVLPVFYDVERSEVQLAKKSLYGDALDSHKQSVGDEKVERWKKALVEAGKVKGWELSSYKGEGELIALIVGEILLKLKVEHNYVPKDLFADAYLIKDDIEPEDLVTDADLSESDIQPEVLFTGADLSLREGKVGK